MAEFIGATLVLILMIGVFWLIGAIAYWLGGSLGVLILGCTLLIIVCRES